MGEVIVPELSSLPSTALDLVLISQLQIGMREPSQTYQYSNGGQHLAEYLQMLLDQLTLVGGRDLRMKMGETLCS